MTESWIALPRTLLRADHPQHPMQTGEPACQMFAMMDCLAMARFIPGDGLLRGQFRASCRFLGKRWNWSSSKVQRYLRDASWVTSGTQAGREQPILTIVNYNTYVAPWAQPWDASDTQAGRELGRSSKKGNEYEKGAGARARVGRNGAKRVNREPSELEPVFVDPSRIAETLQLLKAQA